MLRSSRPNARRRRLLTLAPDAGERGLDFLLEAGDQFAVGGDQPLLGFDLGDDGLLRGEGRVTVSIRLDLIANYGVKYRMGRDLEKND